MPETKTFPLILTPADVLMCRDGRPFEQVFQDSKSEFPNPRTASGALRTWLFEALGVDMADLRASLREQKGTTRKALEAAVSPEHHWVLDVEFSGPIPCDAKEKAYYPAPAFLVRNSQVSTSDTNAEMIRLAPLGESLPGYRCPEGAPGKFYPLWSSTRTEPYNLGEYVPASLMHALLRGDSIKQNVACRTLLHEYRTGLAIEPDKRTAEDGLLYSSAFLRLVEPNSGSTPQPLSLRVDLQLPASCTVKLEDLVSARPVARFGGEGRMVGVSMGGSDSTHPQAPDWNAAERFFTVLITPSVFKRGWFPKALAERFDLISAAVLAPQPFSGWDIAMNRPGAAQYAVPAGSVYFWQKRADAPQEIDPHGKCISDNPEDSQAGWGLCLRGAWNYA